MDYSTNIALVYNIIHTDSGSVFKSLNYPQLTTCSLTGDDLYTEQIKTSSWGKSLYFVGTWELLPKSSGKQKAEEYD